MRKQIKFVFQIGYSKPDVWFETEITDFASSICGGCTTASKEGHWAQDGAERKIKFQGPFEKEHCFNLELTCEPEKAEWVYSEMCDAISRNVVDRYLDVNWVHVSETVITGRHFSVASLGASINAGKEASHA